MKTHITFKFLIFFLFLISTAFTVNECEDDWGFFGHKRINRLSVFTLPADLIPFYKKHIEYITDHAVDPDKRRYATKHEAVRHYIDIDHWGDNPFEAVPRNYGTAVMKYCKFLIYTEEGDTLHLIGNDLETSGLYPKDLENDLYVDAFGNEKTFTYTAFSKILGDGHSVKEDLTRIFDKSSLTVYSDDPVVLKFDALTDFYYKHIAKQRYEDEWKISKEAIEELLKDYKLKINIKEGQVFDNFSYFGILPYNLIEYQKKLTSAFESGDVNRILRYSAEIGHYIGDAHVPLHTSENYNGQLTGQNGIHGFWESRLPELYADDTYDFFVGKAQYIEDPQEFYWNIVEDSHALVDSVLLIEKELSETFAEDQQFCYELRNNINVKMYCEPFAKAFHDRMNGMVESRMRSTILSIGSVWLTAWVDAGQPKMFDINFAELSEKEKKELEEEEKAYRSGEIKGRKHEE